ncbi:cell wall hydrolase [Cohnella caldifontis]|uniref:cell wall hydrolase n=1 Tax=Cohnella caldifontis TaxID=3027471 RepID=UPI0023EB65F8|nr:cell wall hydrolase [Cohnella sp. YIM B05605]
MLRFKVGIAAAALGIFLTAGTAAASADQTNRLSIAGSVTELEQALEIVDGWTYAPVRELSDRMGWELAYDPESRQITVSDAIGDSIGFRVGSAAVTFNGKPYVLPGAVREKDGNAYFPLRILAEAMHAKVGWRADERLADIEPVPEHVVAGGDSLWSLAQTYGTTAEALQALNGLTGDELQIGQRLKVVVPEFKAAGEIQEAAAPKAEPEVSVDPAELALLAKLVEAEAGDEPYEGKLAVASVVLNRVHSDDYPDTVKGVIYAPSQFSPAGNGQLDKTTPSKESLQAAKAALSGENNVPGAVYFFNPKREPGKLKKVTVVKEIGHHVFAK